MTRGGVKMTHWDKNIDRESSRVAVMEESLEPVTINSFVRDIGLKSYPHDYDLPAGINCSGCPYWLQSKEYAEQQLEPKVWDKGIIQRD